MVWYLFFTNTICIANAGDARDLGLISGLGRSPGEGNGIPLQYSCLGNFMDRRTWQASPQGRKELDMIEHNPGKCLYRHRDA